MKFYLYKLNFIEGLKTFKLEGYNQEQVENIITNIYDIYNYIKLITKDKTKAEKEQLSLILHLLADDLLK